MSYDFEDENDKSPPKVDITPMQPDDLEAIVTLIDLASVLLTPDLGATFTFDDLMREINDLTEGEVVIDPRDVQIVLPHVKTIEHLEDGKMRLK